LIIYYFSSEMFLPKTTSACVLVGKKQFEFQQRALPSTIEPGMVLLQIHTVGICGSDVHYWAHMRAGNFIVKSPIIMGHESFAIVAAVGIGVTSLKPGDRVAIEPGLPCHHCVHCRGGQYNLCPDIIFHATPPYDGTLQTYIVHPASFCFKIPDSISPAEAAFMEPLCVGVQACRRSNVTVGSHVLITGAGPIGLVCMLVARASGATKIILVDVNENRLKVAKSLGATAVFNSKSIPPEELLTKLKAFAPITQTLECSGAVPALNLAIEATCPGGKIVSIGRSAEPTQALNLFGAADKEIDILGSFRYHDSYPAAIGLVASGLVNVLPLITASYPLSQAQEAFEKAEGGSEIKIVIRVAQDAAKI